MVSAWRKRGSLDRGARQQGAHAAEFGIEKAIGGQSLAGHQARLVEPAFLQAAQAFVQKKCAEAATAILIEYTNTERQIAHLVASIANGRCANDPRAVLDCDKGNFPGGKSGLDDFLGQLHAGGEVVAPR